LKGLYNVSTYGKKLCYSYYVLEQVCLSVQQNDDPDTPDVEWTYKGGCFTGGRSATYIQAEPGNVYNFTNVMITVRESEIKHTSWFVYLFAFTGTMFVLSFVGLFFAGKHGLLPSGNDNRKKLANEAGI
jgi:hypothetical protein